MSVAVILTILVLLAGFYMAWNIGANDVSNAMGTSVGSGALTLFKAVIIAGVLEFCGAFFLGGNVSKTMQQGIVNPDIFAHDPRILLYGMLSALIATAAWLQVASYFGWPVSTTHAIIGALIGFGAVAGGIGAVQWGEVGQIALSWVISPALSGLFAFLIFSTLQRKVLFAMNPIHATRRLIPVLVFTLLFVFALSTLTNGLGSFHIELSLAKVLLIGAGAGTIGGVISMLLLKRKKFPQTQAVSANTSQQVFSLNKAVRHLKRVKFTSKGERREEVGRILRDVEDYAEEVREHSNLYTASSDYKIVEKMFASLQIMSASYIAFAHGANDVANAIGPVAAALDIIRKGGLSLTAHIPAWLLAMGGVGIVVGLATWGWRVMETIGRKITELTPTRGFSAEFGAAITILVASKLGLPISTTHCIVGAVLGVGLARGLSALNLRTLRDIVLSWVITLPSSAIVSILVFYLIRAIFG
ncbi:inorganic phosphate transporter [Candidatus Neptunochlamydia vexilliferae]|uniref:Phosphate transporter n=1 Tax=Candidatus Neptunichlamydia vexilliferae TaxID=1651774 RepID=A0ABS0AZ41_9BACT|nr:inorganic phosphate transporter [Candidatus Neptunochlamydia vexilliferae]MBF5059393.1 putative phosphate permease [Candidatus Neptunochlamydia vexilliferae]